MGLLSKLFGSRDPYPVPTGRNVDCVLFDGDSEMGVVGESHYQKALRTTWDACNETGRTRRVDCYAVLQPQPNNPHDPNAVAVWSVPGGLSGHLSRADAKRWHQRIADAWQREGKPIAVRARIHSRDGQVFGIWLDWPDSFDE